MDDLQRQLEEVIAGLTEDSTTAPVSPETDLFEAGILDSFRMLEYLTALEQRFGIQIPNHELIPQNFWTIDATAQTLRRHLGRARD